MSHGLSLYKPGQAACARLRPIQLRRPLRQTLLSRTPAGLRLAPQGCFCFRAAL